MSPESLKNKPPGSKRDRDWMDVVVKLATPVSRVIVEIIAHYLK